jgi:hypothetical protein
VKERRTSSVLGGAAAFAMAASGAAWAQEAGTPDSTLEDGLRRVHLMGNADIEFLVGARNSFASQGRFLIDNARLYLDLDLGRDLAWGEQSLARDVSFYVEWDIAREAQFQNTLGSLYLRLDRLAGLDLLNIKVGRFLIPFGEEYLRQSEARPENPLLSFSVAMPYGWSEGVLLFGPLVRDRLDYFLGLASGSEGLNAGSAGQFQVDGKLALHPAAGLVLSGSVLWMGTLGSPSAPARTDVEWGGQYLASFGWSSPVQSFQDGAPIAEDPDPRLGGTLAWEADLVWRETALGRIWLGGGEVHLRSADAAAYDRTLRYWVVEAVFEGEALATSLEAFSVSVRYSAIGTWNPNRGYLLGVENAGGVFGYNSKSVSSISAGLAVRLGPHLVAKLEYSWYQVDLVSGVPASLASLASGLSYGGIGVSVGF